MDSGILGCESCYILLEAVYFDSYIFLLLLSFPFLFLFSIFYDDQILRSYV